MHNLNEVIPLGLMIVPPRTTDSLTKSSMPGIRNPFKMLGDSTSPSKQSRLLLLGYVATMTLLKVSLYCRRPTYFGHRTQTSQVGS